jgi:hypothetical protein
MFGNPTDIAVIVAAAALVFGGGSAAVMASLPKRKSESAESEPESAGAKDDGST